MARRARRLRRLRRFHANVGTFSTVKTAIVTPVFLVGPFLLVVAASDEWWFGVGLGLSNLVVWSTPYLARHWLIERLDGVNRFLSAARVVVLILAVVGGLAIKEIVKIKTDSVGLEIAGVALAWAFISLLVGYLGVFWWVLSDPRVEMRG